MTYTYEELKALTVAKLREIAQGLDNEALKGFTVMHKEQLLPLLCKVLKIKIHHSATGKAKTQTKILINRLKKRRDEALAAGKADIVPNIRQQIHALRRKLRHMAEA